MNRWDGIKSVALGLADNITENPAQRDAVANGLITLVGLMLEATGKGVAVDGEAELNEAHTWMFDPECTETEEEFKADKDRELARAHNLFLAGEAIQSQARMVTEESIAADLTRWDVLDPTPAGCAECTRIGGVHRVGCSRHHIKRCGPMVGRCMLSNDDVCMHHG